MYRIAIEEGLNKSTELFGNATTAHFGFHVDVVCHCSRERLFLVELLGKEQTESHDSQLGT
jgi:hypothetical protein